MEKICLIEKCGKKIYARGVCRKHHSLISKSVTKGRRTWEEFVKFGMALPSKLKKI